jgi:hypothetical protein
LWLSIEEASAANGTEPLPAAAFIAWIVHLRIQAERLTAVIEEWPDLQQKLLSQAERDWRADRIIDASFKKAAAIGFGADKDRILGRKQTAAPQKRFKTMCSEAFNINCGKPLDSVVASLTEIAFDTEVTIDSVRGVRKPTRRDIRGSK